MPTPSWSDSTAPYGRIDRDRPWYGPPPPLHDPYTAAWPYGARAPFHASVPQLTNSTPQEPGWPWSWHGRGGYPARPAAAIRALLVDEQTRARAVNEVVAWAAGDDALAPLSGSHAGSVPVSAPARHHNAGTLHGSAAFGNDHDSEPPQPPFAWFTRPSALSAASATVVEPLLAPRETSRPAHIRSSNARLTAAAAARSATDPGTRGRLANHGTDAHTQGQVGMDDEKIGDDAGSKQIAAASVSGRALAKQPASRDPLLAEVKGRQRRAQLPVHARATLFEWVGAHRENPYPTRAVKNEIMAKTGLTLAQLENWFVNYRRRALKSDTRVPSPGAAGTASPGPSSAMDGSVLSPPSSSIPVQARDDGSQVPNSSTPGRAPTTPAHLLRRDANTDAEKDASEEPRGAFA
ncbi:hypothetical protein AMAG_12459 [Allomyces macrogynus ATCC 38327]|uniref:Homeobox domain-containing protein n=1 Tax=Allomyces macrogynus (strain ATCC 38327) TaxID=578462 RepID=A0A0L0SYZ7_ALLM3|nr:hypothetical protein AMAG_12459 [Allomyces macrogynus ATCC 38327]|eukprot:KNE67731.1 hypothetical protein AMAG_12459 [Allomyces macrogynus ATCC 38327]